jgi:hypothetical protein
MTRKKMMAGIWVLLSWQNSFSQTLEPSVFASAGTSWIGVTSQCSFTIGETITYSLGSGATQLTQGFHQTYTSTAGINPTTAGSMRVYPNPAMDYVVIENHANSENWMFELYDIHGQVLLAYQPCLPIQTIPISHLAPAVYLITIKQGNSSQTYKIIKKSNQ